MQYQVPQFIDVEDKIIGPLTLKQFLYMGAAGMVGFVTFFIFNFALWIIVMVVVGGIAIVLAFIKYNGRPMIVMFGAMAKYIWQPKLYLWRHDVDTKKMFSNVKIDTLPRPGSRRQSKNPLKNLFLKLNTSKEALAGREKSSPTATQAAIKNQMAVTGISAGAGKVV